MLLYAVTVTPRLQHAAAWLGNYLFGQALRIITQRNELAENDIVLNYSPAELPFTNFHLLPHTLLFEAGIQQQIVTVTQHHKLACFFSTAGDFPFDVIAASFYLMQRYEEYLPHQKDQYGRYVHTNSLAYQNGFLHLPLINMWMQNFKTVLQEKFNGKNLHFIERKFQFTPTYDVDIAYDKLGKGWLRNLGGMCRLLYKKPLPQLVQQFKASNKGDLFDVYDELDELHLEHKLSPIYFFLLAQKQIGIDKNISPQKKVYQQLIQTISSKYKTGIHLSAASQNNRTVMQDEKNLLTRISGKEVAANRNHYLLFTLPETYQQLQERPLLITEEYAMGYGTMNGFRGSICTPYYWYNLQTEQSTNLQIFPFCYMDATSVFQQKVTPKEALTELRNIYRIVRSVNGHFITIFHNHLMGRDTIGRQWMEMYQQFLKEINSSS